MLRPLTRKLRPELIQIKPVNRLRHKTGINGSTNTGLDRLDPLLDSSHELRMDEEDEAFSHPSEAQKSTSMASSSSNPDKGGDKEMNWSLLTQFAEAQPKKRPFMPSKTEQKEEMYFRDIFHSILDPGDKPASEKVLKIFEKKSEAPSKSLFSDHVQSSLQTSSRQPSSFTLGINMFSDMTAMEHPDVIEKQKTIDEHLLSVLSHIETTLKSNKEVTDYFESVILPRFNPEQQTDLKSPPCSADAPNVCPVTIATILSKCIEVIRRDFEDPMGAIDLFETAKRYSIDVFANACTAKVYNQIIDIRWQDYRDLYSVLNLTAEIAINAIPPDAETIEALSRVYRQAMDTSRQLTAATMPLWTSDDYPRLKELNRYRSRFQQAWASHMPLRY